MRSLQFTIYNNNEAKYTCFGARYYDSDLSIWLSVDPLSDKYPSLSPFAYCANNPVILVDPDGRSFDEWEAFLKNDGSVKINWISNKGGDNIQIVNFSKENNKGEHIQIAKPIGLDMGKDNFTKLLKRHNLIVEGREGKFPIDNRVNSYMKYPGRFGDTRDGGSRKHAGVDLYAPVGANVYAVKDGVINKNPYKFYRESFAIDINHGDFIARYCEINVAKGLRSGIIVTQGQLIGTVADLSLSKSMLYFEIYSGQAKGELTNRANLPYMRRNDLIDPTYF